MANKYDEYAKILYGPKTKQDKSLASYKARMAVGGVDPDEATDTRNALEKFLNLKKDQNVIFDVFEVLNRPQQALFGGIENAQKGGDFLEGAKQGLFGNKDTQFKDILMNTGEFSDRKGKLDLVDVLGFGGDVFLDPADIIPVAGFSKIGKSLDEGAGLYKALKQGDSISDIAFKGIGKGIKGTAKLADTGIEKALTKLDAAKGVKAYDKFGNVISDNAKVLYGNLKDAKRASDLMPTIANKADIVGNIAKYDTGRLQSYRELKDTVKDVFKKSKVSIDAILTKRAAENTANEVKLKVGNILKNNEDIVKDFATKHNMDVNKVGEDISLFVESMMDRSIEKDDLLDLLREGKVNANTEIENAIKGMQDQVANEISKTANIPLKQAKDKLDLSYKIDDKGVIKLTGTDWNKKVLKENGITSFKDLDEANSIIPSYGNWYSDTDLEDIDALKQNQDFRQMINQLFGEIKDGDKLVIDPLSDSIKVLSYPESQRKWEQLNKDMIDYYKKQGYTETEIMENIKRKNMPWGEGTEGGGYIQTSNSFKINDKLRKGENLGKDTKTVEDLDKFIGGYKSPEDIALLRRDTTNTMKKVFNLPDGLDVKGTAEALKSRIGEPVEFNKAFTSTAVGEGGGAFDYRNALMTIKAPKGTNMFVTNDFEREAILKRGQQMILRDVSVSPRDELLLSFDLYDGQGKYLATIDNNKAANTINTIIDEGFGTNFGRFNEGNAGRTYLPHTLADSSMADIAKDTNMPILRGRTSLLSSRTRLGSMRENNNLYRKAFTEGNVTPEQAEFFKKYPKLFEENFNKALGNKYFDGMTNLAKQHKIVNDTLISQTFGDRATITNLQKEIQEHTLSGNKKALKEATDKYNKLVENSPVKYLTEFDNKVPPGSTVITNEQARNIKNHLKNMKKAVGTDSKGYDNLIKVFDTSKGNIAVNNDVLRMLQVTIDPKQKNAITKLYDKVLDLYKSTKTLSFTNNLNNFAGNSTNLALSGIGITDQARLMPKAVNITNNGQDLYLRKLSGEVLTKEQDEIADFWKKFLDTGFGSEEIALDVQDLPDFMKDIAKNGKTSKKLTAKDVATALPKLNMRANTYVDNLNRITVMLKSIEDPSYLTRLGIEGATDVEKYRKAISKVMFDPSMMTDTEKNVLKRIIPFYTYAKNNLVFQIDNLGRNGSRYNKLVKTIKGLQKGATGGNEENMDDFIKDSLYIPIPGLDENGNYTVLRTQLPFGDLVELTNSPSQFLANKLGPVMKAPYEYATNTNAFTGKTIESFTGQKSSNIPFLTKKQEKVLGDLTGLDVPLKTASRLASGNPLSSITMTNNINTDRLNRTYEQIDDLKNLMKQYEQKGYKFSTVSELRKANKNSTTSNIEAIFAKYGVSLKNDTTSKYSGPYADYEKLLYNK